MIQCKEKCSEFECRTKILHVSDKTNFSNLIYVFRVHLNRAANGKYNRSSHTILIVKTNRRSYLGLFIHYIINTSLVLYQVTQSL